MNTRINTARLLEVLEATPASHNIMLMGKHGIGKSQILEQFFTARGCKVVTLFLGQMSDPGDLIGIPRKNEATGKTEFLPPYWFPTDGSPVVLFLDELNRARPDQLTELDPALVSRFNIYEFVPGTDEWLSWAGKEGLDKRIINYISMNKGELDGDDKSNSDDCLEKTPDRRAWKRVSDIILGIDTLTVVQKSIVAGIIGQRAANRFFEFLNTNRIISAEELLLGKFEEIEKKLESYATPEYAVINDSLFPFLEKVTAGQVESQTARAMSKNLQLYFDFLEKRNLREAMAHFANLFSSTAYPNALAFIVSDCNSLFEKVTVFVAKLK